MASSPPAVASEQQTRNWVELPPELTSMILSKLGAIEILTSAQKVCMTWRNICKDPSMWRSIHMRNLGDLRDLDYDLETMCRQAVDRSSGGVLYINVEYCGTDDLMKYIADRASSLRGFRLVCCYGCISDEALTDAASKFPLLEELEISLCSFSDETLTAIGRCCPLLKSFKFNNQGYRIPHIEYDGDALAIAANMHELRHLQLFGNKLTNTGLRAIFDGCPHLEYLDLRQCFNVNLEGNLGKLCVERIKDLRRPNDPTDDYEFDASIQDAFSYEDDYPSEFSEDDLLFEDDYYSDLSFDDFTRVDYLDF